MTIVVAIAKSRPVLSGRMLAWAGFTALLVVAPLLFKGGAALSLLSQTGTMIIFALAYNMLLGQGGMLSFGHAVYSGLGAFMTIHAMNLAAAGQIWMPVWIAPLVGAFAGMGFAMAFGYLTTKKSGTTFAMITLGIGELVFSCSLMFPEFFGGEGGISTDRVYGEPLFGLTFGPQLQVYYLIAFWLFAATAGMYAFTRTPLGRIINAVRDNPERAEFIGYDTHWARYLTFVLSGFFSGIAGGLSAINFEMVSAENVSAHVSGAVLLFTFIGGAGFFFGPIIGAALGVFLTVMLSDFIKAWQLYLGLFFIGIVMHAPGGVASIVMMILRVVKFGKFRQVWLSMLAVSTAALTVLVGVVLAIEMLYHLTLDSAGGGVMRLFGATVDTTTAGPWMLALALTSTGGIAFRYAKNSFTLFWGEANREIEDIIRRMA